MMKQMKCTLLLLAATFLFSQTTFSMVEKTASTTESSVKVPAKWFQDYNNNAQIQVLSPEMAQMDLEQFMNLTPAKFQELTGQKLSWKKKMQLKVAQKFLKKKASGKADISKGLYVVLAIIGLGWLAMGLLDDWNGSDWIIALVLSLLFWLPGVIYSLIKMKKYY